MNKLLHIYLFLLLFFINIFSDDTIIIINKSINEFINIKNLIKIKENQLNNLKIKSGQSIWDFFNRNTNESIIQNKNRLLKEINSLNIKLKNIEEELLLTRNNFILSIESKISDNEYFKILNFIDDLYYNKLVKLQFEMEYNISDKELVQKRNLIIKDYTLKINEFIKYLQYKKDLIDKYKLNYNKDIDIINNQILNLKNIIKKLNK